LGSITSFKPFLERVAASETLIVFTGAMMLIAKGNTVQMRPLFCLAIDMMNFGRRMHGKLAQTDAATKLGDVIHPLFVRRVRVPAFQVPYTLRSARSLASIDCQTLNSTSAANMFDLAAANPAFALPLASLASYTF